METNLILLVWLSAMHLGVKIYEVIKREAREAKAEAEKLAKKL